MLPSPLTHGASAVRLAWMQAVRRRLTARLHEQDAAARTQGWAVERKLFAGRTYRDPRFDQRRTQQGTRPVAGDSCRPAAGAANPRYAARLTTAPLADKRSEPSLAALLRRLFPPKIVRPARLLGEPQGPWPAPIRRRGDPVAQPQGPRPQGQGPQPLTRTCQQRKGAEK